MSVILWIVAVFLVLIGIAGAVLPNVPGPILVFAGLVLAAWAEGFAEVGGMVIGLMALLTVLAYAADLGASALGAQSAGASRWGVVGAAVGTVLGLFLGIPGLILGPFVGAVVGEYATRRDLGRAGRVGVGAWLGIVIGAALELSLLFMMIGIFIVALFL
jgi:uncharacterized protein YqgC (DUF456 family)